MKSALFLSLTLLCHTVLGEEKKAPTDFIRVQRTEKEALLQPAITTYKNEGVSVTLIGAIHLADKAYYQDLTTRFQKFDRLLFEMIGGESLAAPKSDQEEAAPTEHPLARVYAMVGTFLKLADQKSQIDYTAKNFVHADLTATEFKKLQEEREESILSFALDASENSDTAKNLPPKPSCRPSSPAIPTGPNSSSSMPSPKATKRSPASPDNPSSSPIATPNASKSSPPKSPRATNPSASSTAPPTSPTWKNPSSNSDTK